MCTVLLQPGGYSIAVNKYIISYIIFTVAEILDVLKPLVPILILINRRKI